MILRRKINRCDIYLNSKMIGSTGFIHVSRKAGRNHKEALLRYVARLWVGYIPTYKQVKRKHRDMADIAVECNGDVRYFKTDI